MSGFTLNKRADSEFGSAYNYFMLLKPRVMSLAIFMQRPLLSFHLSRTILFLSQAMDIN